MGVHKDGTGFGLNKIQVEERKKICCHLLHFDVMTSIVSGLSLVAYGEIFSSTPDPRAEGRVYWQGRAAATMPLPMYLRHPAEAVFASANNPSLCKEDPRRNRESTSPKGETDRAACQRRDIPICGRKYASRGLGSGDRFISQELKSNDYSLSFCLQVTVKIDRYDLFWVLERLQE
ncbi:hypothetical protein B0O99DRAFT_731715 [Bisporella sp. PMI_857]|nr:hypothetical protein B0O99DRAFT_731715 [Bisporella sp. PMI_857]